MMCCSAHIDVGGVAMYRVHIYLASRTGTPLATICCTKSFIELDVRQAYATTSLESRS